MSRKKTPPAYGDSFPSHEPPLPRQPFAPDASSQRSFRLRTRWSHDGRDPFVEVVPFRSCRAVGRWIQAEFGEFLLDPPGTGRAGIFLRGHVVPTGLRTVPSTRFPTWIDPTPLLCFPQTSASVPNTCLVPSLLVSPHLSPTVDPWVHS